MSDYLKEGFIDEVKGCLGGRGQENVIESIKVNGVGQTVDENKAVNIPVPTKTSDLDNDSGYITEDQVNSKVTEGVASIVANAPEDFDTLKEMSDWISQHEDSAAAMNSAILKNKEDIELLQTSKSDQDDVDVILEDIGELNSNLVQLELSDVAGGKNLLKWNTNKTITYNGVTFDATQNGKLKLSGTSNSSLLANAFRECTFTLPQGTYTISSSAGGNTFNLYAIDGDSDTLLHQTLNGTFTLSKETEIFLGKWTASGTDMNYDIDLQIEKGTTATPYEPYIPSVKMIADEVNAQKNDLTPILIQKQISESDWSADGNVYKTYVTLTDDIPSNKKILSLYQERMYKGDEQSWLGGIIVNNNEVGTKLVVFSTTKINCTLGLQVVLI